VEPAFGVLGYKTDQKHKYHKKRGPGINIGLDAGAAEAKQVNGH